MFPEMFVLSDKISARYNLFGSGLPTRLRTTVLPWHNPEPVHSVFIHAYTGHLVPEPNRILFHTVTFFNFVLYGLPVLRSAERALASARLMNNRNLRHSYCSRGERSQCPLYWTGLRTLVPADMVQCWTQNFYDTEMNESKMYICTVEGKWALQLHVYQWIHL